MTNAEFESYIELIERKIVQKNLLTSTLKSINMHGTLWYRIKKRNSFGELKPKEVELFTKLLECIDNDTIGYRKDHYDALKIIEKLNL